MLSNREIGAQIDIRPVIVPIDLAAGANSGLWCPVRNYARFAFVFFADPGASGEPPIPTLRQATDSAGTGAKNLVAITRVYVKEHATVLPADFTVVDQAALATFTRASAADTINLWIIEVDPATLDIANGFDFVTINIADTGATTGKIGCCLFIGARARYASDRPSAAA